MKLSVKMRDRTAWRAMMAHVRKGGIDLVLVTKLDRAFRSAKDTYENLVLVLYETEEYEFTPTLTLPREGGELVPSPISGEG